LGHDRHTLRESAHRCSGASRPRAHGENEGKKKETNGNVGSGPFQEHLCKIIYIITHSTGVCVCVCVCVYLSLDQWSNDILGGVGATRGGVLKQALNSRRGLWDYVCVSECVSVCVCVCVINGGGLMVRKGRY